MRGAPCLVSVALLWLGTGSGRAQDSVLCQDLTAPPGAIYVFVDDPPPTTFAGINFFVSGDDTLLTGLPGMMPAVAGLGFRSEAAAEEARTALMPEQFDNITGKGFLLVPPTPSVFAVAGPSAAMVDQLVAGLLTSAGVNSFSTARINNTNDATFDYPACGIGCCKESHDPKITHFTAETLTIEGNGVAEGCGIMIVDGDLVVEGMLSFVGLVIGRGQVRIEPSAEFGVANAFIRGSLWSESLFVDTATGFASRYSSEALGVAVEPLALPWCSASVCGDGRLSPPEQCDDGNVAGGDCCAADCTLETSCDDGNACTENDSCATGTCVGEPVRCESCEQCSPEAGCHEAPAPGCRHSRVPRANRLDVRVPDGDAPGRLSWKWRRGEATAFEAFGNPFEDDYAVCVFGGEERSLLLRATADAGGTCDGRPCWWQRSANAFRYRDDDAPGGLAELRLDAGPDGRARVSAQGRGDALVLPPYPWSLPLTVQLQSASGACWEARYEDVRVIGSKLHARGTAP